ncbi:MAG: glycohydrolase toxin TNT-related protein, partial [Velocimicrobium sp.]
KNNRMTKVVDAEQQVTQYVYDSEGNTLQMQQPGSATSYTYNKNGLPTQILYQMKDGTQMEDNLTYDAIGNIVSSVKKGSTSALTEDETYSYDAIGQLLSYTKGQKTESYTYDMLGNMTEKRVNGTPDATYQYNASNQLTNKTENGIAYSYRYDKRGNQVEEMCGDQVTRQYIYDATNHMVLGRNSENGEKSEYVYNGLSMRVKNVQKLEQTDSSYENYGESAVGKNRQAFRTKETNYVIDYLSDTNNDLLSYETGFGATRVTYGRGSERLSQNVTIYPETPRTMRTDIAQENNGKSYFQTDRLGSVLFASNQEGEVLRYADRDAWGNLQVPVQDDINSAGIADSLGFTNYNYDPVLDQYFAQARFYDAKQGRMLAVDPVKTGLNRYLYCKNDPLNYIDPLGATAQNVKAGISISNKGILTGAANALTGYKKALSSVGNIGNDGSSFANANKCSSNKGTGNLRLLRVLVDDDTWYSPSTGNLVDNNTKGKKLFAYEQDLLNMKNSDNILEAAGNLGKYFWDRWPGLWGELNEQNALNAGLDPEWAELCGDFSSALLLEGFITTTVKGVRAYKNIKTGKIIYANSVVGRGTKGASNSGKWIDDAGNIKWPKNDGFAGSTKNVTLQPGTVIDRYGYESGTFVSPKGVPYEMRSLAPGTELKPYNVYEVIKPLDGLGGKAAAWFDQPGGGTQYKLSKSIQELLDEGYIKEVIK